MVWVVLSVVVWFILVVSIIVLCVVLIESGVFLSILCVSVIVVFISVLGFVRWLIRLIL